MNVLSVKTCNNLQEAHMESKVALERERDELVRRITTLEREFNGSGTISRPEYLRTRHECEQRLITVMDALAVQHAALQED